MKSSRSARSAVRAGRAAALPVLVAAAVAGTAVAAAQLQPGPRASNAFAAPRAAQPPQLGRVDAPPGVRRVLDAQAPGWSRRHAQVDVLARQATSAGTRTVVGVKDDVATCVSEFVEGEDATADWRCGEESGNGLQLHRGHVPGSAVPSFLSGRVPRGGKLVRLTADGVPTTEAAVADGGDTWGSGAFTAAWPAGPPTLVEVLDDSGAVIASRSVDGLEHAVA